MKARGGLRQLRFSPDGSRLAFVSARGDHSFVGVYDIAAKALRWIAPSVDDDSDPAWSPDGTRLAFLRVPASTKVTLFHPNPSAEPWSILVADAATGEAKTVWRAEPGPGSAFAEMVAANQILWAAGDRIVFPWERDGWLHLYSVPAAGGKATLLTPGEFEVEYVNLTPDRRQVLFNSNQDDIDRRHLWRVDPAGGPSGRADQGGGDRVAAGDDQRRQGPRLPPLGSAQAGAAGDRDRGGPGARAGAGDDARPSFPRARSSSPSR